MKKGLKESDVSHQLNALKKSVIIEECWNCECFQGFLAELEGDMEEGVYVEELGTLHVERSKVHACLGCQPCPPAAVYSKYLAARSRSEKGSNTNILPAE